MKFHRWAGMVLLWGAGGMAALSSPIPTLDQTGVNLLRATTTNLYGNGITVGQPEGDVSLSPLAFEVFPPNVGNPTPTFTYRSADGAGTNYPNSAGVDSWHADDVARFFYGPGYGVATNIAHVDNLDADFFYTNYIANPLLPALGDPIVNQSFIFGNVVTNLPTPTNYLAVSDQEELDSEYDDYANANHVLFVSAVNNVGSVSPPGTAYNSIGVAAYGAGATSSVGPTVDNGRCKPDITAPGASDTTKVPATSFSTPQVSGAAAVLLQAAERGDGGADTNAAADLRTLKALLLNGAVKPVGWTNGPNTPLDARYGAGLLNLFNAYHQLAGQRQTNCVAATVLLGGAHPPAGDTNTISTLSAWDFNTNTSTTLADGVNHYYFNVTNGSASTRFYTTATLVWNRQLSQTNINNLRLFLYATANSNLVACSTSRVDNVQHVCVPQLAPGRYDLQVWKAGGTNLVSLDETYAVAFAFAPLPAMTIVPAGTNVLLSWPVYPAGFAAQAVSALGTSPAWSTNNLPASTVTNGQNWLHLNATNAPQFFRLVSPNF